MTRVRVRPKAFSVTILLFYGLANPVFAQKDPIEVLAENSFLIEEAYNQEPDEVQHTFTVFHSNDKRQRGWTFVFTQEWPIFSQEHQFSYTIPSYHLIDDGARQYGIGDIELNYRYQALQEGPISPAFAPEFGLILPTGSRRKGTGDGVVGYEWTFPFSKKVNSRLALNANFGLTYLPKVRTPLDSLGGALSPKRSLVSYIVGGSAIFAILPRFHVLLEWLGEFEDSINDAGKAKREFKPILSPGFRTAIMNEEKFQIVTGVAAPIGLNRKANNYGVFLYFSIEHHFL